MSRRGNQLQGTPSRYNIALSVELTLIDIVMELDDFDPERDREKVLEYWLENKDSGIIEAVENVTVLTHSCLDESPYQTEQEGEKQESFPQQEDENLGDLEEATDLDNWV